ncbi:hypothetical protein [Sphingomicrobium flavum]|uniref:hypothetical protein n=1 Tax=Sphingomicrobium flavum TaxID=1229164 RepID=UPI0021AD5234|nr:hypothetical protein [Sphingomicrobium flavum]
MTRFDFKNSDWIQLVKRTREKFGVSIFEAHDLILADPEVRRLVAIRVNREHECRKMAMQNIRARGDESTFVLRDGRLVHRDAR